MKKLMVLVCLVIPLYYASAQDKNSAWLYDSWRCYQYIDAMEVSADDYVTWFRAGEYMGYIMSVADLLIEAQEILVPYNEKPNQIGRKVGFILERYFMNKNDDKQPLIIIAAALHVLYPIPEEGM